MGDDGKTGEENDYALMGGMAAAFGGIMSRMGLNQDDGSDSSTASDETGIVSRRMNLVKNGDDVVTLDGGVAPHFIEIPKGNNQLAEPLPVDGGIEVEGPQTCRPRQIYCTYIFSSNDDIQLPVNMNLQHLFRLSFQSDSSIGLVPACLLPNHITKQNRNNMEDR